MAFNMQDVLLEPYGGEILGLSVSPPRSSPRSGPRARSSASRWPRKWLKRGLDPYRMAPAAS
jgi:MFS transporter, BCD family, chlorophyll transporter